MRLNRPCENGLALVLAAGVLALTLILAAGLVQMAAFARSGARAGTGRALSQLAAGSGLDYAAARLWEEPRATRDLAGVPSRTNRPDDWTARSQGSGMAGQGSDNPSYARGDGFKDVDDDGACTAGIDVPIPRPPMDLDADGRFDAWTGRLRSGQDPFSGRFSLRIESSGGFVCVNSGELGSPRDDHDLDGILNKDDPNYSTDRDTDGIAVNGIVPNGIPDWRDPDFYGNRHLVNTLNNLGAILGVSSTHVAPYCAMAPAMGGITTSDLGRIVVSNRPRGGYGSVTEAVAFLPPADRDKVLSFLTVQGTPEPVAWVQPGMCQSEDPPFYDIYSLDPSAPLTSPLDAPAIEFHVPIDFQRAPVEVLRALLRHVAAGGCDTHTLDWAFVRLGEAEADDIAQRLAAVRATRRIMAWSDLLDVLHADCGALFRDDPFTCFDETADPLLARRKEDLVMAQLGPAGYFDDPRAWRHNTLEVVRDTGPVGTDATSPRRVPKTFLFGSPCTCPYDVNGGAYADILQSFSVPCYATTEVTLCGRPPGGFRISSEGWREDAGTPAALCSLSADLAIETGRIPIRSQQEFEQRGTSPASPWRLVGGDVRTEGPCQGKSAVQTTPKFPLESLDAAALPGYPGVGGWMPANAAYPRVDGGVRLASRPAVLAELAPPCVFALPFDADPPFPVPVPPTLYDPADFRDNAADPIEDTLPPLAPDLRRCQLTAGWESAFHGYLLDTQGPRLHFPFARWQAPTHPFPLPLSALDRIQGAAITAWFAWQGGEPGISLRIGRHAGPTVKWLDVLLLPDGSFTVRPFTAVSYPRPASWTATPEGLRAGWHHLAVVFDATGANLSLFVDGKAEGAPVPVWVPGPPDPTAAWTLVLSGHFDDVRFHAPAPATPVLMTMAQEDRYAARTGTYTSPRFLLDPARFPDGVTIRGVERDGFVPAATRGSIEVTVRGFDAAGALLGQASAPPWTGTEPSGAPCRLAGCFQADVVAVLKATDPEPLPVGDPPVFPNVLRDTPILDTLAVVYSGRPRFVDFRR